MSAVLLLLASAAHAAIPITPHDILSPKRLELTREYCRKHYGLDSAQLVDPKIIVIHATEIATFTGSLRAFTPETLPSSRTELKAGGELNVGIHFLVDRDGSVHSLIPPNTIARHVIGLNHVAVGIENVGFADKLTPAQIDADVALVRQLLQDLPTLHYLIGHYEYADKTLPHYGLFKELDTTYRPTIKSDPGRRFMTDLRKKLAASGIALAD